MSLVFLAKVDRHILEWYYSSIKRGHLGNNTHLDILTCTALFILKLLELRALLEMWTLYAPEFFTCYKNSLRMWMYTSLPPKITQQSKIHSTPLFKCKNNIRHTRSYHTFLLASSKLSSANMYSNADKQNLRLTLCKSVCFKLRN